MPTIWRKILADFRANKTRTFLMILTITLGVFSLGFIGNIQATMNRDMSADFNSSNPAEASVSIYPITDDWVRSLATVPGVRTVEGRAQLSAQLVQPNGSKISIRFEGVKTWGDVKIGILKPANPADGILPRLERRDVALDRSAGSLGLVPGQTLEIELPDGHTRQLHFTGYVHDVTAYPYNFTGYASAYVTEETLEWLGGPAPAHYNRVLISVAQDPTDRAHVLSIAQAVADRFKKADRPGANVSVSSNPGYHFAWQILQSAMLILSMLGWMTVVLSGFLIINTIMALMSQHIRQIGIMKAIGGEVWQIFGMYLVLLLIFSAVALAASIPLSAWASYQVCAFMAGFLNYELGPFYIDPNTMLFQTLLAVIVPLAAALAPLINSVRIPVREALNNYGIGSTQAKSSGAGISRLELFPRPVLISLRNAFRRKMRVSLTLCALVSGGAIFIAVCNHWLALDRAMRDVQGYFLADINFTFSHVHPFDELKSIAMRTPGVEAVEGWGSAGAEIMSEDGNSSDEIEFLAPPAGSVLIHPILTDGRWLTPLDRSAIVIGNHLLKIRPELKVGDWVTIKLNGLKRQWQIVGIYRMPGNVNPPLLYTNNEYLSGLLHQPELVYDLHVTTFEHDAQTQDSIARQMQSTFEQRNIEVSFVQQGAAWMEQQKNQTDVLAYFLFFMAVLIAFVGGLGLMGLMSINVMERTREIGVMRAIGAGNGHIQAIVIVEGLVIGLASWLLAVILSVPITYLLDYSIGVSIFQAPLSVIFNWTGSFIWLGGILVIAALASAVPAWRASQLTIRETLVYE